MKKIKEPAFPFIGEFGNNQYLEEGLTKREYFAGLAMQGFMAMCAGNTDLVKANIKYPNRLADMAITFADELLNQLENGNI